MHSPYSKPFLSPRSKLNSFIKSPTARSKSKISSPMHSIRPSSITKNKHKTNNLSNNNNNAISKRIVWVSTHNLYTFLKPLERVTGNAFKFCQNVD